MKKQDTKSNPLPRFERPSEAVVYWTLANLCRGAGGRFMLSVPKLARHCGLSASTTHRAILDLAKRGVIIYRRGYNQSRPSIFEIPLATGREDLSPGATAPPKIGTPNYNDSDNIINDLYIGDNDIAPVVPKQYDESEAEAEDRLAHRVAEGLNDLKNLALYLSYCRRFPAEIILKAYVRAREPHPDKIKVSRGALFNFLVRLYARKQNPNSNSRPAAR